MPKTNLTETIELAEFSIQVVRSKRRSISLQIKPEGVVIRSPRYAPKIALKAFALSKLNWLRKHQQRIESTPRIEPRQFISGESMLYKGQEIKLDVASGTKSSTLFNSETKTLTVIVSSRVKDKTTFIKKKVVAWYKQELLDYLEIITPKFADEMELEYKNIKVKDYKARWGSCSAKGELSFNWRIMMSPEPVIESVVIHELAHLRHFNHSKSFWKLVYTHCQDYKQQHDWLKINQYLLNI